MSSVVHHTSGRKTSKNLHAVVTGWRTKSWADETKEQQILNIFVWLCNRNYFSISTLITATKDNTAITRYFYREKLNREHLQPSSMTVEKKQAETYRTRLRVRDFVLLQSEIEQWFLALLEVWTPPLSYVHSLNPSLVKNEILGVSSQIHMMSWVSLDLHSGGSAKPLRPTHWIPWVWSNPG